MCKSFLYNNTENSNKKKKIINIPITVANPSIPSIKL